MKQELSDSIKLFEDRRSLMWTHLDKFSLSSEHRLMILLDMIDCIIIMLKQLYDNGRYTYGLKYANKFLAEVDKIESEVFSHK